MIKIRKFSLFCGYYTKTGFYELHGGASSQSENFGYGDSSVIFVEVSENDAIIGNKFKNKWGDSTALSSSENNEDINSELLIIGDVELNKEFKMIYRFTADKDFIGGREKQINLNFPSNAFEIKNVNFPSNCEYQNQMDNQISCLLKEIKKDQQIEISADFKTINEGEMYLSGSLSLQADDTTDFIQDSKTIWMHVDRYNSYYELTE